MDFKGEPKVAVLDLHTDDYAGARKIVDWLQSQLTTDRPTFSAIVGLVVSDIEDSMLAVEIRSGKNVH